MAPWAMAIREDLIVETLAACMPLRLGEDDIRHDAISVSEVAERRMGDRLEVTVDCDLYVQDGYSLTVVLSFDAHAPSLDDARVLRVDD